MAKIALHQVLEFLASPRGEKIVRDFKATLEKQIIDHDFKTPDRKFNSIIADWLPDDFIGSVAGQLKVEQIRNRELLTALPGMMTSILSQKMQTPHFSVSEVQRNIGKTAAAIVEAASNGLEEEKFPARKNLGYWFSTSRTIVNLGASLPNNELAARMPVLRELLENRKGSSLAGFEMVCIQHLFPTTESLFDAFIELGLKTSETTVIGKPYSTDIDVYARMMANGFEVSHHSRSPWFARTLDDSAFSDALFKTDFGKGLLTDGLNTTEMRDNPAFEHLSRVFSTIPEPEKSTRRFLLLDDGGKLIKTLHDCFPRYTHLCLGIEQTDRGIQLLEKMELKCPVVNVARSMLKKLFESPMIGESIVWSIEQALQEAAAGLMHTPKTAVVIGYGAVGRGTAQALARRGYEVHIYDNDETRRQRAKEDGFHIGTRKEVLSKGHLLVSCTGGTTLRPEEYDLLPQGAILANGASGNHELGAEVLPPCRTELTGDPQEYQDELGFRRTTFAGRDVLLGDLAAEEETFHRVVESPSGARRLLLSSGYVVNMGQDIPPEFIQLTRALLLAGVTQAISETEHGLTALSDEIQAFIEERMRFHLGKLGLSLEAPDFTRVPPVG